MSQQSTKDFNHSFASFGPHLNIANGIGETVAITMAGASRRRRLDQTGRGTSFRQSYFQCSTRCGGMLRPARRQPSQLGFIPRVTFLPTRSEQARAPTSGEEARQLTCEETCLASVCSRSRACCCFEVVSHRARKTCMRRRSACGGCVVRTRHGPRF